jgi:hypothetical protein
MVAEVSHGAVQLQPEPELDWTGVERNRSGLIALARAVRFEAERVVEIARGDVALEDPERHPFVAPPTQACQRIRQQRSADTHPPAPGIDIQGADLCRARAGLGTAAGRSDRAEADRLAVSLPGQREPGIIGCVQPVGPVACPRLDGQAVERLVGKQPAIADLPRANMDRGDVSSV